MNIPSVFIQILVQMSLSIFIILGHFRIFNKPWLSNNGYYWQTINEMDESLLFIYQWQSKTDAAYFKGSNERPSSATQTPGENSLSIFSGDTFLIQWEHWNICDLDLPLSLGRNWWWWKWFIMEKEFWMRYIYKREWTRALSTCISLGNL